MGSPRASPPSGTASSQKKLSQGWTATNLPVSAQLEGLEDPPRVASCWAGWSTDTPRISEELEPARSLLGSLGTQPSSLLSGQARGVKSMSDFCSAKPTLKPVVVQPCRAQDRVHLSGRPWSPPLAAARPFPVVKILLVGQAPAPACGGMPVDDARGETCSRQRLSTVFA